MDLSLSDEQEQLVEAFGTFFLKECPPAVVRASEETDGFDATLWEAFGALGGPAMGADPAVGGGGASLLDLELVTKQCGAVLAAHPTRRRAGHGAPPRGRRRPGPARRSTA